MHESRTAVQESTQTIEFTRERMTSAQSKIQSSEMREKRLRERYEKQAA